MTNSQHESLCVHRIAHASWKSNTYSHDQACTNNNDSHNTHASVACGEAVHAMLNRTCFTAALPGCMVVSPSVDLSPSVVLLPSPPVTTPSENQVK